MNKIVIGGSPCTYWSISKINGREVEASGEGWELYRNYLLAVEKFKPDYFFYENNKSISQTIKDAISASLGVVNQDIDSALVSAQKRQRSYWHNIPNVNQPQDKKIYLKDILESGLVDKEKSYCLKHQQGNARDYFKKKHTQIAFEKLNLSDKELAYMFRETKDGRNHFDFGHHSSSLEDKSSCVVANFYKGVPYNVLIENVDDLLKIGLIDNNGGKENNDSQAHRVYSSEGKSVNLIDNGGGQGAKTGLYTTPLDEEMAKEATNRGMKVYHVVNNQICVNGVTYDILLPDGFYLIRKLTVKECCRLQGLPDWWFLDENNNKLVSDTQAYKAIGNGWQLDTVKHIFRQLPLNKNEPLVCLSMYDGISSGRRILEELGYTNVLYLSYEIDKYCLKVSEFRYPQNIQLGDAFGVREANWERKIDNIIKSGFYNLGRKTSGESNT